MEQYLVEEIKKAKGKTIQKTAEEQLNEKVKEGWKLHSLKPAFASMGNIMSYQVVYIREEK